jgi:ketosteroid isomerase-like protein
MHKFVIALAVVALGTLPLGCKTIGMAGPSTPEQTAVMAPVHQFVDGFNAGDVAKALAACTDSMSIIDDVPPHEWHGAGSGAKWLNDYDADAKKNGITDGFVNIEIPRHVDVNGDRAYVVCLANYTYKQKGKPVHEAGSTITIALRKEAAGWRITAWAWAKN